MDRPQAPSTPGDPGSGRASLGFALEVGWLLVAVLVPLLVVMRVNQPFDPPKVALLRSLAWILLGVWLVDCRLGGCPPFPALRRNPLAWPVATVAAVLVLATLLAPDPRLGLFGSYTRSQGLLTWLAYLAVFLVVSDRVRNLEQARRLVTALVATAAPLVVLSAFQAAGLDPLRFVTDARSPIYATLGRANFVGAYLAMLMPLTLAELATPARSGRARSTPVLTWALGGLLVAEAVVVGLTRSRGAWLAAGTGVTALTLLWSWDRLSRRTRLLAAAGTGTAAALLAAGSIALLQASAGSIAARRTIWQAVLGLLGERPWLGYGPDGLELVFPRVFPPQLVYYQGRGVLVDRAHNLALDWAVTAGLLGVVAMVLLLVRFLAVALKRWRELGATAAPGPEGALAARRSLLAAAVAGVAANLAGNLVSFDVTTTASASWLLVALAVSPALGVATHQGAETGARAEAGRGARPSWPLLAGAALIGLAVAVGIVQGSLRPLLADAAHRTAVVRAEKGDWQGAAAAAERAVKLWPSEPEHHRLLGQACLGLAQRPGSSTAVLAQSERGFLAARDLRPLDYRGWAALGDFYLQAPPRLEPGAPGRAQEALRQAVTLAPHDARLHVAWGEAFLAERRLDLAFERFARAAALDATDTVASSRLGETSLALGRPEVALDAFENVLRHETSPSAYLGLARSHRAMGRSEQAWEALRRAAELEPQDPLVTKLQLEWAAMIKDSGEGVNNGS